MATYILVHGAWHGGWCWHRVAARLRQASHTVLAPDLKSLGVDRTPVGEVTLLTWTQQISSLVLAQADPVVLVGHSRGGIVLSEVAELVPERVQKLIYVTAFLLENGRSLQDAAATDPESLVGPGTVLAADHQSATIRGDLVRECFYGQCSDDDVELASSLLVPEPLKPLITAVHVTNERFGRVPRTYVECTRDRAITLPLQRRMQQALPCRERITLETDHSPFFSQTAELTNALLRLAG